MKVKHVLGISGGKDSAALAIYLNKKYSNESLPIEYYSCDTGNELDETYKLISQLEVELGQKIRIYQSSDYKNLGEKTPFHFFLKRYGGYLPSQNARWCTKNMKLEPFEREIGDTPTISYVGIRGDEDREGYISTKSNIQSIFPFRKNIWSKDVIKKLFTDTKLNNLIDWYKNHLKAEDLVKVSEILVSDLNQNYTIKEKVNDLLNVSIKAFNHVVFDFLKTTEYPVGKLESYPLLDNEDILVRQDIFNIIENSAVDLPAYYKPIEYEVDGEKGKYFRSRSGCYFCFFQQKIEWVWLLEQHPDLFQKAIEFEKDGYTWVQGESLENISNPERVIQIKREHLNRMKRRYQNLQKPTDWQDVVLGLKKEKPTLDKEWVDQLLDAEGDGCASCFI